jgi:membrane-associated phospholipid phosphatase
MGTETIVASFLIAGLIITYIKKDARFLKDWAPFLLLWIVYDQMRYIADNQDWINVKPVYNLEFEMFGWMFGDKIPAFWAQEHQNVIITLFFSFIYTVHPIAPLILAIVIYYKSKDQETFKEFSHAFLLTCYLALITFALYPVAPPWYIWNEGNGLLFRQPEMLTNIKESAAGLIKSDDYLSITAFGDFYGSFNSNPYAAVPSLHSAFSCLTAYYTIYRYKHKSNKVWLFAIYPVTVWCAAVYLNHHFVVDLIAGLIYAYFSIKIVRFIRRKRGKTSTDISSFNEVETSNTK